MYIILMYKYIILYFIKSEHRLCCPVKGEFRSLNLQFLETNGSDNNFILLQRRFDASCIIFKLRIRIDHNERDDILPESIAIHQE